MRVVEAGFRVAQVPSVCPRATFGAASIAAGGAGLTCWSSIALAGVSAGRGERSGAREGVDERRDPGPRVVDAQRRVVGVKREPASDVQQPVAQALGRMSRSSWKFAATVPV